MSDRSGRVSRVSRESKFKSLMRHRVKRILLVSSAYDSFVLDADGRLTDLIYDEYLELNLTSTPLVRRASTSAEALELLRKETIDLITIFKRVSDIDVMAFSLAVKEISPTTPITLLAYHENDLANISQQELRFSIDWVFAWTGDVRILLSMIKLVEDRLNVDRDTASVGVRVIILVEDSVKFYSSYLPLLYTEIMQQTRNLMSEGLNLDDKLLRMRARPKILLATTYEEACKMVDMYKDHLLGAITDARFEKDGELDGQAGLKLISAIRETHPDLPILMQSSELANKELALKEKVEFLYKNARDLHSSLRKFIKGNFGFGDFVFCLPDGTELARAGGFRTIENCLKTVDAESIRYHGSRNHFSNWLMARTEFDLAAKLRPLKVTEFSDAEEVRSYLVDMIREFRHRRQLGVITDFQRGPFDLAYDFVRIGGGSLGGKGRGLAFINALLSDSAIANHFEGVKITVPFSAVLGTEVFDVFMQTDDLLEFALDDNDDEDITARFLATPLPADISGDLETLLKHADFPLAVRSSSMLEDSHLEPFAGVYDTHMLVNNHPDLKVRQEQVEAAIKTVYASTFGRSAKVYHKQFGSRVEEEKMAVILQQVVGSRHGDLFYPTFSGVGQSYNYYSIHDAQPEEGVVYCALGLGKSIVEGMNCLRFSPVYPQKLWHFASTKEMLDNSQHEFYAIDFNDPNFHPQPGGDSGLIKLAITEAEKHGSLDQICSTYSPQDDRVHTGTRRQGIRIITFAPVLKGGVFPLAKVMKYLLEVGSDGLNCPIEMEFAVDLQPGSDTTQQFHFLQIRPLIQDDHSETVSIDDVDSDTMVLRSDMALGNMHLKHITDVVYVDPEKFDRSRTVEIAAELASLNAHLRESLRQYLLIGPGRWGTAERWLGIPVVWDGISFAKVIVEAAYGDFGPDPSFGTHFFQNLTTFQVGYLTVNEMAGNGFLRWAWLKGLTVKRRTEHAVHVVLPQPIDIRIDGRSGRGLITTE